MPLKVNLTLPRRWVGSAFDAGRPWLHLIQAHSAKCELGEEVFREAKRAQLLVGAFIAAKSNGQRSDRYSPQAFGCLFGSEVALGLCEQFETDHMLAHSGATQQWWMEMGMEAPMRIVIA